MLTLEVYAASRRRGDVVRVLTGPGGVDHVVEVGASIGDGMLLFTAEVSADVVGPLLSELLEVGVSGDDLTLIHRDGNRPVGSGEGVGIPTWGRGGLATVELEMASRHYSHVVPRYLVFMACAGVIALFGIFTNNAIAVVGAMAISPDLFPLCATCVSVVDRRLRLGLRAMATLTVGLATTGFMAYLTTLVLAWSGYGPANGSLGDGGLGILPTVNLATVGIAAAAGIAGILSFESQSSSAVGVAISITTVPAAAFAGAAFAIPDLAGATGAIAVLAANVAILVAFGSATLLAQRRWLDRP